jgi:hypothetical protein
MALSTHRRLWSRPRARRLEDLVLVTLAVMQVLWAALASVAELRSTRLSPWFPYLLSCPSGYGRRPRKLAATFVGLITTLGRRASVVDDDVRIVDSTPRKCARLRETVRCTELTG